MKRIKKIKFLAVILIFLVSSINITTIVLSGSRRGIILVSLAIVILILDFIINVLRKKKKGLRIKVRNVFVFIICILLLGYIIFNIYTMFNEINSTVLSRRYETLLDKSLFSSRLDRWIFSMDEFNQYEGISKLIGKGTGYDKYIFFTKYGTEVFGSDYPHNMFLTDILNGGIIKLTILVALLFVIFKTLFALNKNKDKSFFVMLLITGIIVGFNSSISGSGLIYNKLFWIFVGLLALVTRSENDLDI